MTRHRNDDGASLVLIIVLVFMVGLIASTTLTFADTSLRASGSYGERAEVRYDVDGALQAAINQLRNSNYLSLDESGQPNPCPELMVPGPTTGRDVRVTCEPRPGSGAPAAVSDRVPQHALIATQLGAPNGEVGITQNSADPLRILGDVHSESSITAAPGPIVVDGTATAVTGCTGDVRSDATNCSSGTVTAQTVVQPTGGFTPRAVPTCPGNGSTIRFQPGFYYDAAALSTLMNTCAGSTFWFPGADEGAKYYFDFHNGEVGSAAGEPEWTITNPAVRIVGGGTTPPGAPSTVTIPGSCTSPLWRNNNGGVQFVFGGRSRLRMTAGQMELCGPGDLAANAPPVAVFGAETQIGADVSQQAGNATPPDGNQPGILKMLPGTGTDPLGCGNSVRTDCFTSKDRIVGWGTSSADSEFSSTGSFPPSGRQHEPGWKGAVRIRGYDPDAVNKEIPPGSRLVWANLYVRHREPRVSGVANPTRYIHVTVRPSRPSAPLVGPVNTDGEFTDGVSTYNSTTPGVDTVDLLDGDLDNSALQQEVTRHGLSGLDVDWLVAANLNGRLNAGLDSIQISIGWVRPGFASERTGRNTPPSAAEPDQPGILKSDSWSDPAGAIACGSGNKVECFDNKARIAEWGVDADDGNFAMTGVFPSSSSQSGWRAIVNASGYAPSLAVPEPGRPPWMAGPTIIPPGSTLTYAKLYVRHREERQTGSTDPVDYIHVVATPARSGAPQVGPANPSGSNTPGITSYWNTDDPPVSGDTVDLMATPTLANEVREHGLKGFNVQWIVAPLASRRLNAGLDSIQIALGWTTPADFRPQTTMIDSANCVGAPDAAYPEPGSCALVQTAFPDASGKFHVQGTGYAPRAVVDLRQPGIAAPAFSGGLIARAAALDLTWDPQYTGPGIMVPGPAPPLTVLFQAYTCPNETCQDAADWELRGTALVQYRDPSSPPRAGKRGVTVRSWSLDP